jgi:hypothetical protein
VLPGLLSTTLLSPAIWVVSGALFSFCKARSFMFSGLLIILLPLVIGYLIPLHRPSALKLIARLLSWIVYVILFFMGISLPSWIWPAISGDPSLCGGQRRYYSAVQYCRPDVAWQKCPGKIIIQENYPPVWQWLWNPFSYAAWCLLVF